MKDEVNTEDDVERAERPLHTSYFILHHCPFILHPSSFILLLVVLTLVVYGQTWNFPFVSLDDHDYVLKNIHVPSPEAGRKIVWAFTTFHLANWHPLTWLSYMLDYHLFGMNPGAFHLVNVAFHLANTLLLFAVLRRMTGAAWRSAAVAALFAVHPIHAESVAWISERKDVLSTFFGLLAILAYVNYVRRSSLVQYAAAWIAFALSLMAKPMLVTLPCVLLLLDFWPLKRMAWITPDGSPSRNGEPSGVIHGARVLMEKIPFFLLTVASSVLAYQAQSIGGTVMPSEILPFGARAANAALSYVAYLCKMVWPTRLAVFYPHPGPELTLAAAAPHLILLCAVSILALALWRSYPYLLVGWFWYLGTLVPVIGLVQVGQQAMADRYSYVPSIGVFIVIVWTYTIILGAIYEGSYRYKAVSFRLHTSYFILPLALAVGALTVLGIKQVSYWRDGVSLFERTIRVTGKNRLAENNLALELADRGRKSEAIVHYERALDIFPRYADAHNNLGVLLFDSGRQEEAGQHYRIALRDKPDDSNILNNMGLYLAFNKRAEEAAVCYLKAMRKDAECVIARLNLGNLLISQGRFEEALGQYREALRIDPRNRDAHFDLGAVLKTQGKTGEALEHFGAALAIDPNDRAAREHVDRIVNVP